MAKKFKISDFEISVSQDGTGVLLGRQKKALIPGQKPITKNWFYIGVDDDSDAEEIIDFLEAQESFTYSDSYNDGDFDVFDPIAFQAKGKTSSKKKKKKKKA